MDRADIYRDIAARTNGDIYIGVVGPVRTGKSTFIKRFSELLMLPNIRDEHTKRRIIDELPQSGAGKSIMTTQPKFVPSEAVSLTLAEGIEYSVRLVDCVGYLIEGAIGHMENDTARMVTTPWFTHDIPFEQAAKIGTEKVIAEHSTIGIVMTTDGSITEIPRDRYLAAEAQAIREVKATGKPFVVVVNTTDPDGESARAAADSIRESYGTEPLILNVLRMDEKGLTELLTRMLYAFPLKLIELRLPSYMRALDKDNTLIKRLTEPCAELAPKLSCLRDYTALADALGEVERFEKPELVSIAAGSGTVSMQIKPEEGLFFEVLSSVSGCTISNDYELMSAICEFSKAKREYDRVSGALLQAQATGYGMVAPQLSDMELLEPEITRKGNRFGVKLKAKASGLHVIRVDIDTEVNPIVGTEQQSEAMVKYFTETFEHDPDAIWQTDFFGKSLYDLVCEGMQGKVAGMPELVQQRMQGTIQRIVNDGCNGLICIML